MGAGRTKLTSSVADLTPIDEESRTLFLSLLEEAAKDGRRLFPLPPLPRPPTPSGKSRRVKVRHRKACRLWVSACSLGAALNDAWGEPYIGVGGGSNLSELSDRPLPARLRFAEGPPYILRVWGLLLGEMQEMPFQIRPYFVLL